MKKEKQFLYNQISKKIGRGITIKKSLCFYNPRDVYQGLKKNNDIRNWQRFMNQKFNPKKKKILLIYPCSTVKPYDKSRSYQQLYKHLDRLNGKRDKIQIMTISEPFGLVPEEYYSKFKWYDCPGLFEWWCHRYDQEYDKEYLEKSLQILADKIGRFLKKAMRKKKYKKIIAFVRTYSSNLETKQDHTHRRMLELAAEKYNLKIEILPTKNQVRNLVNTQGAFAWDMYGVAHSKILKSLVYKLNHS